MGDIVKSGYIKRYSKSFLSGGWNQSFLTLHRDSRLNVYKKQGDSSPQGSIYMKDVCKHFAFGEYTNGMPDRPDMPSGTSLDCVMAIPQKPNSKAKIHWFLFLSSGELHDWMNAIISVLPPPAAKDPNAPHTAKHTQHVNAHPPSHQPIPGPPQPQPPVGAAPALGFENLSLGGAPPPPAYQPPPPQYPAAQPYAAPQYPQQYPQQYPRQGPHYPPPPPATGGYPRQPYYPQTPAYPQQSYHYQHPPVQAGAPYYQQPVQYVQGYPQQQVSYGHHQPNVVYQTHPPVTVIHQHQSGGNNMGKMAAGVAGGALLGYGAASMMGGGMMGGGWGMGRWGSWSSMSSFGSFGSCGSFGSFG